MQHYITLKNNTRVATLSFKDNTDTEARHKEDQTPLGFAAYFNNVKVVKLLVECNADIKVRDEDNKRIFTLLHTMMEER